MKIEPPLSNLIGRCQTMCVAECCGVDAYDFSPVQIASFLTMWHGLPDESEIKQIKDQLQQLRANYGSQGASGIGVTIEEMNQVFSGSEIDVLTFEMETNMEIAIELISTSESRRYRIPPPK